MLVLQTLDKLSSVGLGAMAAALREQLENPAQYLELSFEDRHGQHPQAVRQRQWDVRQMGFA